MIRSPKSNAWAAGVLVCVCVCVSVSVCVPVCDSVCLSLFMAMSLCPNSVLLFFARALTRSSQSHVLMTLWLRPVSLFLATRSCATDSFACQGTPRQIPHGVKAVCQASPGNPHTPTRKGTCGLLGTDKAGVHFALIQRWIPFFSTPFFLCVCVCVSMPVSVSVPVSVRFSLDLSTSLPPPLPFP